MKRQTLTEKTADELLRYIQEHQLKPGDRIATEADLQKDLGVGRNTIREALRLLMSSDGQTGVRHLYFGKRRGI